MLSKRESCFHESAFISKEVYKRWQGHHSRLHHYFNWRTWCDETCVNWLLNVMKNGIWFCDNSFCSNLCTVSSDFTADEKMEIESIKTHKKDLLDDIQVNAHTENTLFHTLKICVSLKNCFLMNYLLIFIEKRDLSCSSCCRNKHWSLFLHFVLSRS